MINLDNLGDVEGLGRSEFYKIITGVDELPVGGPQSRCVDPFSDRVNLENMEKYMRAIVLFEKCEGGYPGIYQENIDAARKSYEGGDLEGFKQAIREILADIISE